MCRWVSGSMSECLSSAYSLISVSGLLARSSTYSSFSVPPHPSPPPPSLSVCVSSYLLLPRSLVFSFPHAYSFFLYLFPSHFTLQCWFVCFQSFSLFSPYFPMVHVMDPLSTDWSDACACPRVDAGDAVAEFLGDKPSAHHLLTNQKAYQVGGI